jgi:hypothetical protein
MGDTVVVIYCSEDGDHSISQIPKYQFLKHLKDYFKDSIRKPKFFDPIINSGDSVDLMTFSGYIVIEGKIVTPKPVQVATEYEI